MRLLIFGSSEDTSGTGLQDLLRYEFPSDAIVPVRSVEHLERKLKRPAHGIALAVLMVAGPEELSRLLSIRHLFHDTPIILILPQNRAEMVAEGHYFRPRFVTFLGDDWNHLLAVLRRFRNRHTGSSEPAPHLAQPFRLP